MSKGRDRQASGQTSDSEADNGTRPADLDRLRQRLVPFQLHFFQEVGSTNDIAADLARGAAATPAVVVAGRQTSGRGQRGRSWFAGRHSLAATFVLPVVPDRPAHQLPILAGLAVREALAELVGEVEIGVKWPNDVQLKGRKLAGVLCERKHGVDLVGIGINVDHAPGEPPGELREQVIALSEVLVSHPHRWDVLAMVASCLRSTFLARPPAEAWAQALEAWPRHDVLYGRAVDMETPQGWLAGRAEGIEPDGRLRLVGADGVARRIPSGSVRLRAT